KADDARGGAGRARTDTAQPVDRQDPQPSLCALVADSGTHDPGSDHDCVGCVCHSIVLSDQVDGPGGRSASTLVPVPGWTEAPQIVPARIVWRTELGQQLPGKRETRRRAGEAAGCNRHSATPVTE